MESSDGQERKDEDETGDNAVEWLWFTLPGKIKVSVPSGVWIGTSKWNAPIGRDRQ